MKDFIQVHNPSIKRKDLEYVLESMINDKLEYGDFAKALESKLSERTGCKYALAVNSHYSAIDIVMDALALEEGDEILIPSYAPKVYLDVAVRRKLTPVIIDCNDKSFFPGIEQISSAITEKTKALVIVHNFGYTIDCSGFVPLVPSVIEDITKVPGALAGTQKAGSYGTYAVASFASSELVTTGEGGAIFTNSKKEYQTILERATFNPESEYRYTIAALIPDINAAMGVSQLTSLDHRLKLRETIGKIYEEALSKSRASFIQAAEGAERYYADFPIQIKSSIKDTIAFFKKNGIEVVKPYETPLHQHLNLPKEAYPNTEKLYLSSLLIPASSTLLKKEVDQITKLISALL